MLPTTPTFLKTSLLYQTEVLGLLPKCCDPLTFLTVPVCFTQTIQNALQGISALLQPEWLRVAVIVWGFLYGVQEELVAMGSSTSDPMF